MCSRWTENGNAEEQKKGMVNAQGGKIKEEQEGEQAADRLGQ